MAQWQQMGIINLDQYQFRWLSVVCSGSNYYLKQIWIIGNWTVNSRCILSTPSCGNYTYGADEFPNCLWQRSNYTWHRGHRGIHKDSWWRHQMETFSVLLAICAGNSPVPGRHRNVYRQSLSLEINCQLITRSKARSVAHYLILTFWISIIISKHICLLFLTVTPTTFI